MGKWNPNGANYDAVNDNFWYVLYGTDVLGVGDHTNVFTSVKIPETMTQDQAAKFAGGFEVKVLAQAVQTKNVGVNAYEAFQTVKLSATDAYNEFVTAQNP